MGCPTPEPHRTHLVRERRAQAIHDRPRGEVLARDQLQARPLPRLVAAHTLQREIFGRRHECRGCRLRSTVTLKDLSSALMPWKLNMVGVATNNTVGDRRRVSSLVSIPQEHDNVPTLNSETNLAPSCKDSAGHMCGLRLLRSLWSVRLESGLTRASWTFGRHKKTAPRTYFLQSIQGWIAWCCADLSDQTQGCHVHVEACQGISRLMMEGVIRQMSPLGGHLMSSMQRPWTEQSAGKGKPMTQRPRCRAQSAITKHGDSEWGEKPGWARFMVRSREVIARIIGKLGRSLYWILPGIGHCTSSSQPCRQDLLEV